mmetsp:Transcript_5376/g.20068  ORF Transcript_5376/g.20068 Transcript_5376/m.20068 type:complete len:230 (-) Transcript_5376:306-995(-)
MLLQSCCNAKISLSSSLVNCWNGASGACLGIVKLNTFNGDTFPVLFIESRRSLTRDDNIGPEAIVAHLNICEILVEIVHRLLRYEQEWETISKVHRCVNVLGQIIHKRSCRFPSKSVIFQRSHQSVLMCLFLRLLELIEEGGEELCHLVTFVECLKILEPNCDLSFVRCVQLCHRTFHTISILVDVPQCHTSLTSFERDELSTQQSHLRDLPLSHKRKCLASPLCILLL